MTYQNSTLNYGKFHLYIHRSSRITNLTKLFALYTPNHHKPSLPTYSCERTLPALDNRRGAQISGHGINTSQVLLAHAQSIIDVHTRICITQPRCSSSDLIRIIWMRPTRMFTWALLNRITTWPDFLVSLCKDSPARCCCLTHGLLLSSGHGVDLFDWISDGTRLCDCERHWSIKVVKVHLLYRRI